MSRIWGFDVGTTSVGWTVIDYDSARSRGEILQMGTRIFPESRDPDGTPLNQGRRQKRLVRRQLRRRRARRRALNECLTEAGLLPPFCTQPARKKDEDNAWHVLMRTDPVGLRKRGIDERLDPHELGRALYHLAQRRHFKGRDLEDEEDELDGAEAKPSKSRKGKGEQPEASSEQGADEKAAKADREATLAALKASKQTLGQFLAVKPAHERRRGIHATRSVVSDEFDRLWTAQSRHHAILSDPAFRARVEDIVFAQRPVFWRKNTLGKCRFMPDEPLCPKGSWLSQQRRMLEKLNNLSLVGGNARPLDAEERAAILAKLQTQALMTWGGVRSALKPLFKARGEPGAEKRLKFNLELDKKETFHGNPLEAKLARIFERDWADHPHRQGIRDAIHQRLWAADYGEIGGQRVVILAKAERQRRRMEAGQSFIADFGITADQAEALTALKLPTGWEPYSAAALSQFIPHLEAGVRFSALLNGPGWQDWRDRAFPDREQPTGEVLDRLPSPTKRNPDEMRRIASLRNPTVVRIQNELRKVVNNLIGAYGKPDLIRVELAREVGKSKRERDEIQNGQREQEKRRRQAAADLRSKGIEPSRADIEKWVLWKECGEFDPYSGKPICFDDLFRTGEFDVEHIWPRSKCFDNGFANKTLCLKSLNARKANRTPFEAFGANFDEWPGMKNRVWSLVDDHKMKKGKAKRFCREEPLDDDFTNRQLNDTGFAARQAVAFLKRLWLDLGAEAPVTVQVVTGRVTAQLRRVWGLNNILSDDGEKTRADHRHHAIDALVVACVHPGMTQRLSAYWQLKDDPAAPPPRLDPPWPTIRADAERAVSEVMVSHRVRRKVSGPLHAEMPWGYTGQQVVKNGRRLGIYVKRMPVEKLGLETLKITGIEEISRAAKFVVRDDAIRKALLTHLEAAGAPPAKAYSTYPRVSPGGPEIRKVRVLTVQQTSLMVPVAKVRDVAGNGSTANGYADPANNHHIAIYRRPDGKAEFEVVSLFEASRRLATHEPVVRRKRDGADFVMSLSAGDAIQFRGDERKGTWIVGGVWASGQVVLELANDAGHATTTRPVASALLKNNAHKISVDPIGRVRASHD